MTTGWSWSSPATVKKDEVKNFGDLMSIKILCRDNYPVSGTGLGKKTQKSKNSTLYKTPELHRMASCH